MTERLSAEPWVRLPAAPWHEAVAAAAAFPHAQAWIWPLAVEPAGRRRPESPLIEEAPAEAFAEAARAGIELIPLLDHAGPMAGLHLAERPLGPEALVSDVHGRTARALDEADWSQLQLAYARAVAVVCSQGATRVLLGADHDGLLAATVSPRTHPSASPAERIARIVDLIRAIGDGPASVGLALCVEELCPGGLDASAGVDVALACERAGCRFFVGSGGSASLPALRWRAEARGTDDVFLASAAWLVGRVSSPVWASGPCPAPSRALRAGRALGLAGVVCESGEPASPVVSAR